jgi:hypothetical protein
VNATPKNFVSIHDNHLLGRSLKIPNTGLSFVQLKWVGQNAMMRRHVKA